jgi:ribosome-associated translation inhibitor RaiA
MFNPDFDPLQDLQQCMIVIAKQQEILDVLIKTHKTILSNQQKHTHLISTTRHLIDRLQRQLDEIKSQPTTDRPRRE